VRHYTLDLASEGLHLSFGINILADINSISRHCQQLSSQVNSFLYHLKPANPSPKPHPKPPANAPSSPPETSPEPDNPSGQKSKELYYWDVNRATQHGKVATSHRGLALNILTGTTPYDQNTLRVSFENIHLLYSTGSASLVLNNVKISRLRYKRDRNSPGACLLSRNVTMFRLPKLECTVEYSWGAVNNYRFFLEQENIDVRCKEFQSTELEFIVKVNMPLGNSEDLRLDDPSIERIVGVSTSCIIHYEAGTVEELINLPQLRHEYLLLHGIKPAKYSSVS
jgi:hypothetical protein